ncbi:hypothetical protein KPH14_011633 [Odynerus spinipes]|uniref:EGF-like domain-containing protein n=1 Tax=Odynerus spinipes TaxID=1348599 RepID=A0AAD9VL04_9HYME|nr:hypothetical protein KPH14_011633 [Odynerus spinipes]
MYLTRIFLVLLLAVSTRCMCSSGYTGQNCENEYIPCDPSPCQNGGSCRSIKELDYQCLCPDGFRGKHCEENIDDCPGNLCQNGATCIDRPASTVRLVSIASEASTVSALMEKQVSYAISTMPARRILVTREQIATPAPSMALSRVPALPVTRVSTVRRISTSVNKVRHASTTEFA